MRRRRQTFDIEACVREHIQQGSRDQEKFYILEGILRLFPAYLEVLRQQQFANREELKNHLDYVAESGGLAEECFGALRERVRDALWDDDFKTAAAHLETAFLVERLFQDDEMVFSLSRTALPLILLDAAYLYHLIGRQKEFTYAEKRLKDLASQWNLPLLSEIFSVLPLWIEDADDRAEVEEILWLYMEWRSARR